MPARPLAGAFLALILFTSASAAADYSHVRCDDPRFEHYMISRLPNLRNSVTGIPLSQRADVQGIASARTLSASPNKLICEVRVNLTIGATPRTWRSRFTTQHFPDGRTTWKWQPMY